MSRREFWRYVAIGLVITVAILALALYCAGPTQTGNPFGVNQ